MADNERSIRLSLESFGAKTTSGWASGRISAQVASGETLALIGRAGSGKTLVLEQIAGVLRPGVKHVGQLSAKKIEWVPQDARLAVLPTDRVWSLLGVSGLMVRLRQWGILRTSHMADENRAISLMQRIRLDPDRILELPFRELSATERRGVLLTRALLADPEVLAIDGWGEQMDGPTRRAISELLKEKQKEGLSLLISSRRYPLPDLEETRAVSLADAQTPETPMPLIPKASPAPPHEHVLLEVTRLSIQRRRLSLLRRRPPAYIVDGASLFVRHGECLAILGTAGSGKTALLEAISGLTSPASGTIVVEGNDVTHARGRRARRLRRQVQLVFQDATSVLDGARTVLSHLEEAMSLRRRQRGSPAEWLERLGLYPRLLRAPADQLSASEGQRVDFARSLVVEPKLVLFDAPEVSGAAEDAGLLAALLRSEKSQGRAFLIATSNPELARSLGDRVAILHAGRIIEIGSSRQVLTRPAHPLTLALLQNDSIPGHDPTAPHTGCPFVSVCPRRILPQCDEREPMLAPVQTLSDLGAGPESGTRRVACFQPIVDGTQVKPASS